MTNLGVHALPKSHGGGGSTRSLTLHKGSLEPSRVRSNSTRTVRQCALACGRHLAVSLVCCGEFVEDGLTERASELVSCATAAALCEYAQLAASRVLASRLLVAVIGWAHDSASARPRHVPPQETRTGQFTGSLPAVLHESQSLCAGMDTSDAT